MGAALHLAHVHQPPVKKRRPKRHTPSAWWFAEQAYGAYLKHIAHAERTTT